MATAPPALRLFPARVAFVVPATGRLTDEAIRTFDTLQRRVGGTPAPLPGTLYVADANGNMQPLPIGLPGQVLTVNGTGDGVEWA